MRRLYSAILLCVSLLIAQAFLLTIAESASTDPIEVLLRFPAPPPPDPDVRRESRSLGRSAVYGAIPGDDASLKELLDFWNDIRVMDRFDEDLYYRPRMSDVVFQRLAAAVEQDPKKLINLLSKFPRDERSAEFIKRMFDREGTFGAYDAEARETIIEHLKLNSPYYTSELYERASGVRDTQRYVSGHDELLRLAKWDFNRARPILDNLYRNDTTKATRMVATWAFYLNAIKTGSLGDAERYRDELKAAVENRNLMDGVRDLAMDALVAGGDWPGRDDWYMSLLSDPTLYNIQGYTGLTTLINASEPGKYVDKMIELLGSSNPTVRKAAMRNLGVVLTSGDERVIRAMLPWLTDPKWIEDDDHQRDMLVGMLSRIKIPESIPGLIAMLDERADPDRQSRVVIQSSSNANSSGAAPNAARAAANAAGQAANAIRNSMLRMTPDGDDYFLFDDDLEEFPFRRAAIAALGFQGDRSAAPALRRMLGEVEERDTAAVIDAMVKCGAFEIYEQIDAIEFVLVKDGPVRAVPAANGVVNRSAMATNAVAPQRVIVRSSGSFNASVRRPNGPAATSPALTQDEIRTMLGRNLLQSSEHSDELARAMVDHIISVDQLDRGRTARLREAVFNWTNPIINALHLHDIGKDRGSARDILKVLAYRHEIREKIPAELFALTTGTETSAGIATCIVGDWPSQKAVIESGSPRTQAAMLACARMIRVPLSVAMVEPLMFSENALLAAAAEAYLISEDSIEARNAVLKKYPGRAMIFGAWNAFWPDAPDSGYADHFAKLMMSFDATMSPVPSSYLMPSEGLIKNERRFQREVLTDADVLAIYAYDKDIVRIFEDRVSYTWEEDEARYQTRDLSSEEFETLRLHLANNNVDEMPPDLSCVNYYPCEARALTMVGRSGGRRIFTVAGDRPFFAWIEDYFVKLREGPMTTKYTLGDSVRGLEIVYADNRFKATTVWKNGADIRSLIVDADAIAAIRAQIEEREGDDSEIDIGDENEEEDPAVNSRRVEQYYKAAMRQHREEQSKLLDIYEWRKIENGKAEMPADQPAEVPFRSANVGADIDHSHTSWKARHGNTEYRAGTDGIYKIGGGNLSLYKKGRYSDLLVTSNGRWLVATKSGGDIDPLLVRIELASGREFPVGRVPEGAVPIAVAEIGRSGNVLILNVDFEHWMPAVADGIEYGLQQEDRPILGILNSQTGAMTAARGEMRPLVQQTFRPLQPTADGKLSWAAIPNARGNSTDVGVYDQTTLAFRRLITIPKIKFDSMAMWVDEPEGMIYFAYRGHILKLPLDQAKER